MAESDIQFTFDAEGFNKAIKSMGDKIGELGHKSATVSKEAAHQTSDGVMKGLLKFDLLKKGVGAILGAVKEFVPEIGQSFSISRDVILKNFMMPLRRELLPLLQGVLNWTRDNRANFVKFGEVMVSVFRLVKTVVTAAFETIKPLIDAVFKFVRGMTGGGSLLDTINVVLFKVTAAVLFLMDLLKPLYKTVADIVTSIGDGLAGAFKGFKFDIIEKLASLLGKISTLVQDLDPAFSSLGGTIGTVLGESLKVAIGILGAFVDTLSLALDLIHAISSGDDSNKALNDMFKKYGEKFSANIKQTTGKSVGEFLFGRFAKKKEENMDDGIITKDGKVIHTSPDDNIVATKSLPFGGGRQGGGNVSVNFGNFNVTVTEGNAENAGRNLANGLQGQIRNLILDNLVATGGR